MLFLATVLYAFLYSSGKAAPLFPHSKTSNPVLESFTSLDEAHIGVTCPRQRINIIWTCLATILAASWVSVHPNMPHPHDSMVKKSLRRLELMFWAVITPELIIFWAMRQWYGALKIKKEFAEYQSYEAANVNEASTLTRTNKTARAQAVATSDISSGSAKGDFKWTKTHGFFIQMGGFMIYENGRPKQVLSWKKFKEHYKAGRIDISTYTEDSINDHSKADGFAKGIAVIQTFWFITQCVVRLAQKDLTLTELELATAALAVLSLVMYLLWWNKPFNAQVPIAITISQPHCVDDHTQINVQRNSKDKPPPSKMKLTHILIRIMLRVTETFRPKGWVVTPDNDPIDKTQRPVLVVPTFYSIFMECPPAELKLALSSFSIATLFGAIHCAGWFPKVHFTSYTLSLAWRISSTVITGCPLIWSVAIASLYADENYGRSGHYLGAAFRPMHRAFLWMSILTMPVYICSRILLLVIAFVELQNIPPGALMPIHWATVLPFIQ